MWGLKIAKLLYNMFYLGPMMFYVLWKMQMSFETNQHDWGPQLVLDYFVGWLVYPHLSQNIVITISPIYHKTWLVYPHWFVLNYLSSGLHPASTLMFLDSIPNLAGEFLTISYAIESYEIPWKITVKNHQ